MTAQQLRRFNGMDGMRFVMAVGIVLNHFVPYFLQSGEPGYELASRFLYFVDIFFIVSGFFLTRSLQRAGVPAESYKIFILLRLARIYPLYFACLGFYILLGIITVMGIVQPENPGRYDLGQVWAHVLLIQSWGVGVDSHAFNYVAWALSAWWLMYLLLPPVLRIAQGRTMLLGVAVVGFAAGGEFFARAYCGTDILHVQNCDVGFVRAIPSFLFGVFLATGQNFNVAKPVIVAGMTGAVIVLFALPFTLPPLAALAVIYALIYCLLAADMREMATPLSWKGITWLSKYSYAIYLVHPIIATVGITFVLFKFLYFQTYLDGAHGVAFAYAGIAVMLAAAIMASVAAYHLLEKPANRYFRRKILGEQADQAALR